MKHFKHLWMLLAAMLLSINVWGEDCDYSDDFSTVQNNTSFSTRTSTAGWQATYACVETFNEKTAFKINGKKGAKGVLTSPSFSDGCSHLTFIYGSANDTKVNCSVVIEDGSGNQLWSSSISKSGLTKGTAYTFSEDVSGVSGTFKIKITNTSTSTSTSNVDRIDLCGFCISSATGSSDETTVYSVTLKDDETVLTQESAGANVTLPSRTTTCTDYTFVGWSETNCATETTTAPTIVEAGDYKPSKNIELYPVFKKTEGDDTPLTATVNIASYATANSWVSGSSSGPQYKSITADGNINISTTGTSTSGKYYSDWRLYQNDKGNAIITAADGYTLKSVKITYTSNNGGQLSYGTTIAPAGYSPSAVIVSGSSAEFKVTNSGTATNGQARVTAIEVKYTAEAKDYYIAAPTCVIPTVEKPTLSLAAGEYWGAQNVKVSNYNSEYTYYYTLDGNTPDKTSAAYVDADGINVTASATLKVIAYNGAEASAVASAEYTIKPQFASLEELVAADLASNTEVKVSFSNVRIKDFYLNGSSVKKGVYFDIQKEGKDIEIYINSADVPATWEVGGKLSIENLTCNWTRYVRSSEFQCWELTPSNWDGFNYTAAPTLDRVVVSGDVDNKTYIAGEKFNPAGLVVTAYDTENTPEEVTVGITWTVTPERVDAGVTSVSVTATYNGKTSEPYTVSGLSTTPVQNGTIADFISAEGGRRYLTGVVSDIKSTTYGNYTLTDASGSIYVYGTLNSEREAQKFEELSVEAGDKIKVIAEQYNVYSGTKQAVNVEFVEKIVLSSIAISGDLSKATYDNGEAFDYSGLTATGTYSDATNADLTSKVTWSIEPAALTPAVTSVTVKATLGEISATETYSITVNKSASVITIADMEIGIAEANVAIVATTTPEDATLTYTIVSGEDYITLADGKVSAKAVGTAVVKAAFAGNDEYEASEKTFNVTVSSLLIAKKLTFVDGDETGPTYFTDNTDIFFNSYKGGNTNNGPAVYNNALRMYQNGNYITIGGTKGVKIQSVELTTTATYNSTTVGYCVDDNEAPTSGETVEKSSTYTISNLDNQSVSIYCLGTTKETRLEIASLIVKYTKEVVALDHIELSGTYTTEFVQNETFNHDDVVVTAYYTDNDHQVVTGSATFSTPDLTTTGTKTVTVTYTENEVEKSTSYNITVVAEECTSIALSGEYKTLFKDNEEFSTEGLVVKADYNSGRKNIDVTVEAEVSTPVMTQLGEQEITVSYGGQSKTYKITVYNHEAVFYESFNTNEGTGANDGQWGSSIATATLKSDNADWTFVKGNGASKCAKFGAGSSAGSAETPAIAAAGSFKLTFKAAAWNGNSEATTLNLSATNATIKTTSVTLVKGAWTEYTAYIVEATEGFKVKFEAAQASNNRFFLDEVMLESIVPVLDHIAIEGDATELKYEAGDTFNPAGLSVKAYYTMDGVLDESKTQTLAAADFEWSFSPATLTAGSESVEVTATYETLTATKTITGLTVTQATETIREGLTPGNYGTICLENGVDAGNYTGATFYSIVKLVGEIGAPEDLILEEVDALEAGKPYIFAANDTKIEVIYNNETSATAGVYNGLVGSFTEKVISTITTSENIYGVSGKFIVKAGSAARVRAHGAYIDLNQINDLSANAPAAGMRRISMKDQNAEVTTGISGVSVSADAHKLLIDGKLYIVREGKMFNANGQLIK